MSVTDLLTPLARQLLADSPHAYSTLVPHAPSAAEAGRLLEGAGPPDLLSIPVVDTAAAHAMLAGVWLWHDALKESHEISQSIPTPDGSFWHAIMHRREGDFSNAKYWYARCRHHPALERAAGLARDAAAVGGDAEPLRRITLDGWDPDAFVDVVEAVHREPGDPLYAAAVRLQRLEWRALFDHCARRAAGME